MSRRVVVRRKKPPVAPKHEPRLPTWTDEEIRRCPCEAVTVTWVDELALIAGPGRLVRNQWAQCGKCQGSIRVAPIVAWQGKTTNEAYTLRDYVAEGGDRRLGAGER